MSLFKNPYAPITDDETLYRSVRVTDGRIENGCYRVSASAFNDRGQQPSVDRAALQTKGPEFSKKSPTDGILSLNAKEIRKERVQRNNLDFILDIKPDPVHDNQAHAVIVASPEYRNDQDFRKIKECLARLATVEIQPT